MHTRHPIPPVRSVLLYPRDGGEFAPRAVEAAAAWIAAHGGTSALPSEIVEARIVEPPPGCEVLDPADIGEKVDLTVSLGGDGTLLRAARLVTDHEVPVVGVNLGDLGFLSAYGHTELEAALDAAFMGKLVWEDRLRASIELRRGGESCFEQVACNDMYIKHGEVPRMLDLSTSIDGHRIADYRADGLIVCTPTGSTAYNLAAGGPIVSPGTNTLIITPICPHSLTHRPVVTEADRSIRVVYRGPDDDSVATLSVDGQWNVMLEVGDEIIVRGADHPLQLVPPKASVFDVLAAKLGWSGPERAPTE